MLKPFRLEPLPFLAESAADGNLFFRPRRNRTCDLALVAAPWAGEIVALAAFVKVADAGETKTIPTAAPIRKRPIRVPHFAFAVRTLEAAPIDLGHTQGLRFFK